MKALQLMAPFQNPRFAFQQAHNITRHLRRDKERCVLDNANSAISSASNGRASGMWEPLIMPLIICFGLTSGITLMNWLPRYFVNIHVKPIVNTQSYKVKADLH